MKDPHYFQLVLAATILSTTTSTKDILLPLIPTLPLPSLPLPDVKPTPEYTPKPVAPVCQNLNTKHEGYNASQVPGDILLCQGTPTPTQPSNIVGTTTSRVVKTTTTTNTTTTEVRTITTTTTTTIDATTTSTNTTMPMDVKPCRAPEVGRGAQYNWWQILLESGGKPGAMEGSKKPNKAVLDSPPSDPCERPLEIRHSRNYAYKHEKYDGENYQRKETGYLRFYGSPREFLDVRGFLVWRPPKHVHDETIYLVNYIVDDTGFWVKVRADD